MNATDTGATLEHAIGETGTLSVRVASWDVEVVAVDGATVRVRNGDGGRLPDLEIEREEGILSIKQPSLFGFDIVATRRSSATKLSIEVPRRAAVEVHSASGDIQGAMLHGPVRAKAASGDILLVDVAGEVQAETVSGDAAIRLDGPTVLALKTVSGDAIVEGGRVDRFVHSTTSGDLRVTSELGEGPHAIATVSGDVLITVRHGIRVVAQTLTGDLKTDLPHTSDGRAGRRSLTVGEGSTVVQFRSVSGDLRVVGANGEGTGAVQQPPAPPAPPAAPAPSATASTDGAGADPTEDERLDILRALERGEIDVDEATSRLAALDTPEDA
jgi:hypothetical protein